MPLCKIKYNKYKHKKSLWISYGIIKSIKYRDKLYRNLKCMSKNSPCYANTKLNLKTYNTILKMTPRKPGLQLRKLLINEIQGPFLSI